MKLRIPAVFAVLWLLAISIAWAGETRPFDQATFDRLRANGEPVLKVNYDTQKDVRLKLGVAQQSTFIVFRGTREIARSTGDTDRNSIAATLRKGLS